MYEQIVQYVWDFIPLLCILIFHKINFKESSKPTKKLQIKFMTTDEELQNRKIEVFVSQLIDETVENVSSDLNEQKIRKEIYESYSSRHQLSRVSLVSESEQ